MELDKIIKRYYTKELDSSKKNVYELFEWKKVDVVLTNYSTGEIITDMKDLEFPKDYSQSACDIIASKYFRKKGVPNERGMEYSMIQLADRMVGFWVDALVDEKLINDANKQIVYDELVYMLLAQIWAPNSPQWFNTGLQTAYNITGSPQGHYYYNEELKQTVQSEDAYTRTQGSACFIISVLDSLIGDKSLTDQLTTETLLFKYGSGVGTNWSTIRGKNESLSGGGKSSGLLSFLKVSDQNAGAIKSGGTTRRAAKMVVLDVDHPELLDFIDWKAKEEDKVLALGKMGYSTTIDGEAYATVSGQNSNNSVRVSDKFMSSVHNDGMWELVGRTDDSVNQKVKANVIWDKISQAAWKCGDPGMQFDDTINAWHTCPNGEDGQYNAKHNRINASNPCSEYMFLDDTACNLASINVMKFLDVPNAKYDIKGYIHSIRLIQLVLEATIHKGQFPTADIARKSYMFRTTGLGLTNLGMLFMSLGYGYDSDESRHLGAALTTIMTAGSYHTSALMAQKVGPFAMYDLNRDHMLKVIRNHARVANYNDNDTKFEDINYSPFIISHELLNNMGFSALSDCVRSTWTKAIDAGVQYGYRNAQVSVLAPTGTIAFAMDCVSTSSEPFFSHVAYKKLVGGGFMEIINPALPNALTSLGYNKIEIDDIIGYVMAKDENGMLIDGKIEGAPHLKEEHLHIFDTANKCGSGTRYISPEAHVKMMSALTPNVTGAISKTVNLPNDATFEDIKNIYELSWKLGIKAIALYRDGCKVSQPLNTTNNDSYEKQYDNYTYNELLEIVKNKSPKPMAPIRRKPSGIRNARVHEACINGLKLYITASFDENHILAELYVSSGRQGSLTKGLLDSLSTTISEMLQYGVPAKDIAKMYRGQKYEPSGFVTGHPYIKAVDSISDLISKIIDIELGNYDYCQVKPDFVQEESLEEKQRKVMSKKYNYSDYVQSESCPTCKSNKMVQNGTCKICTECGTTTGCS